MHFTDRSPPRNEKIQTATPPLSGPANAPAVVAATGYRLAWCDEHSKHIVTLSGAPFGGCWDTASRRRPPSRRAEGLVEDASALLGLPGEHADALVYEHLSHFR